MLGWRNAQPFESKAKRVVNQCLGAGDDGVEIIISERRRRGFGHCFIIIIIAACHQQRPCRLPLSPR